MEEVFWSGGGERQVTEWKGAESSWCPLTFLHCDVHGAGAGTLEQLLVGLGRLVKELHEQCAGLLVLTAPNGGQLVQLLLDQTRILQGVFQSISTPNRRRKGPLKCAADLPVAAAPPLHSATTCPYPNTAFYQGRKVRTCWRQGSHQASVSWDIFQSLVP